MFLALASVKYSGCTIYSGSLIADKSKAANDEILCGTDGCVKIVEVEYLRTILNHIYNITQYTTNQT